MSGWHVVYGNEAYVEDGKVVRGTVKDGIRERTTYPYRRFGRGWRREFDGISLSALRSGLRRGTVAMM